MNTILTTLSAIAIAGTLGVLIMVIIYNPDRDDKDIDDNDHFLFT